MNKEEADLIIAEQNKSKEEILKAVAKVKSDYHELCKLKDMRIAELEKENAELKDYRLTTVAKQQTDLSKYALNLEHKLSWYDDQLTKAKEIISEYINILKGDTKNWKKTQEKAEQFISEVEK